jgi:hypothetical protein
MTLILPSIEQRKNLNISDSEYEHLLCNAWEKWSHAIFSGKHPQEALAAAQNYLMESFSRLKNFNKKQ